MPKIISRELPEIELTDNKSIGERISEVRKSRGLSQLELAEKVGIDRRLLSDYEVGRCRIYGEMITRLAIALDVVPGRLLGFKENQNNAEGISLRYTKRIKEIEELPEHKKRALLKTLDDLIKANKTNL